MDLNKIYDLLQDCTVKVTIPTQGVIGTGFFVAPGLVLTCFHVIKHTRNDEKIEVFWSKNGKKLTAEVKKLPEDTENFDMVLLKVSEPLVSEPFSIHPCAYLDESRVAPADKLYSFGYLSDYKKDGDGGPVLFECEGLTGNQLIKFKDGQVQPGLSGAALLNRETGKVCGMVKQTRDRSMNLGGGAIPMNVIFSQFPELKNVSPVTYKEWIDVLTPPVPEIKQLDENDIEILKDLLKRIPQVKNSIGRRDLCQKIRIDPDNFEFMDTAVNVFISQLVTSIIKDAEDYEAVSLLCQEIGKIVKGNLLIKLQAIEYKIKIIKDSE